MYDEMKPVPSYKGNARRAKSEDSEVERIKALLFEGKDEEENQEDPADKLKELFQPEPPKNTLKDWIKRRKENQLPW